MSCPLFGVKLAEMAEILAQRAHTPWTQKTQKCRFNVAFCNIARGGWWLAQTARGGRCVCVVSYTSGGSLLQVWMTSRWQGRKGRKGSRSCRRHESDRQSVTNGLCRNSL